MLTEPEIVVEPQDVGEAENNDPLPVWLYCTLTRKQMLEGFARGMIRSSVSLPLILAKSQQAITACRKPRAITVKVATLAAVSSGANFQPIRGGYHANQIPLEAISCTKLPGRYEKLHRIEGAGGIVIRAKQEILLLLKAEGEQLDWVLPKGRRKRGESRQEAALRETLEETGLKQVKIKKFLGHEGYFIFSNKHVTYKRIGYYLMYCSDVNSAVYPEHREGFIDGRWVDLAQALTLTTETRAHSMLQRAMEEMRREK